MTVFKSGIFLFFSTEVSLFKIQNFSSLLGEQFFGNEILFCIHNRRRRESREWKHTYDRKKGPKYFRRRQFSAEGRYVFIFTYIFIVHLTKKNWLKLVLNGSIIIENELGSIWFIIQEFAWRAECNNNSFKMSGTWTRKLSISSRMLSILPKISYVWLNDKNISQCGIHVFVIHIML
jgi:hypothetical protein